MKERELHILSHPQKRIWYNEQIYEDSRMHNIGGTVRIRGGVRLDLLRQALAHAIQINEGMRIRLLQLDEDVYQYVEEETGAAVEDYDFSLSSQPEQAWRAWVREKSEQPFSIIESRLFYLAQFTIGEQDHGYMIKLHHIIADGWSIDMMIRHIHHAYERLLLGEPIELDSNRNSYFDYVRQEQLYLGSKRKERNRSFWLDKFAGSSLPVVSEDKLQLEGKRFKHVYSAVEGDAFRELAAALSVSLNGLFTGLFALYWHKALQKNELMIGMPLLNRTGKDKTVFGMCVSTMPFGIRVDPEMTAQAWFSYIHKELQSCYYHQKYPYDLLIQDLTVLNQQRPPQLFDMCINYYNTKLKSELSGLPVENEEFYNGRQSYALQMIIREWSDAEGIALDIDYRLDSYTEQQMVQLVERMNALLRQIALNPNALIGVLRVMTEQDRLLLDRYNETAYPYPQDKTVLDLFEEQAGRSPHRSALRLGDVYLTYEELNNKANGWARQLRRRGVEAGGLIGLLTAHSIETVISILAVWKCGCAYLPLDTELPAERVATITREAEISFLITNIEEQALSCRNNQVTVLQAPVWTLMEAVPPPGLETCPGPGDAAYVIYTSGSTGVPKGAVIDHGNLTHYICWARRMYTEGEDEVFPLYSSLAFDLTVTSIFTPLISGGEIAVYPSEETEHPLYKIIRDNRATVVKLTPSHLSLLTAWQYERSSSSIRCFIVGGEDLKVETARAIDEAWNGQAAIYNEYGPTEATVGCMICKYDRESHTGSSVPIGYPADNVQILLLDDRQLPVPPGVRGEIYIAGNGVARGYLNRPFLTAERFVAHPMAPGQPMYRTGDYATQLPDGCMVYEGRIDMEVKIRGHRVNLSEIEASLLRQPDILQACVIDCKHDNGTVFLCAYLIAERPQSSQVIRRRMSETLPGYMVPEIYMFVDHLPLTVNGKIDRSALPLPLQQEQEEGGRPLASYNDKGAALANALREVLGAATVQTKDQFFQLGGDSIKAIQLSSRLRDSGWRLKVKEMLQYPVLEDMANRLEREDGVLEEGAATGAFDPLPAMAWLLEQHPELHGYHQSVLLEIHPSVQPDQLEQLLQQLVQHHDGFRINYDPASGQFVYRESLEGEQLPLLFYDLSLLEKAEQQEQLSSQSTALKASIDPFNGFQLRMALFRLGQGEQRLLLTAHHCAVDGVSWRILLSQLGQLLRQSAAGERLRLPARTASLRAWSERLYAYARELPAAERSYWEAIRESAAPFWPVVAHTSASGRKQQCDSLGIATEADRLSMDETRALLTEANKAYSTKTHELLISALACAILEYSARREMVIELEGHGREEIGGGVDVSSTIGWFTSIFPIKLWLDPSNTLGMQIASVKERLRQVPMNGFRYGLYKHIAQFWPGRETTAIRFNYLGEFMAETNNEWFRVASEYTGPDSPANHATHAVLDVHCYVMHERLELRLFTMEPYIDSSGRKRLMQLFKDQIRQHLSHCLDAEEVTFTPSDFQLAQLSQQQLDFIFED